MPSWRYCWTLLLLYLVVLHSSKKVADMSLLWSGTSTAWFSCAWHLTASLLLLGGGHFTVDHALPSHFLLVENYVKTLTVQPDSAQTQHTQYQPVTDPCTSTEDAIRSTRRKSQLL